MSESNGLGTDWGGIKDMVVEGLGSGLRMWRKLGWGIVGIFENKMAFVPVVLQLKVVVVEYYFLFG